MADLKKENGFDINIKTAFPDVDLYFLAGMFLSEAEERGVDVSLIKQHIRRAASDSNSLALVMGPLGVIPNIYRRFTIEDVLKSKHEIVKIMENVEKLEEEYAKYKELETEDKKDEFYLKSNESFKLFSTLKATGNDFLLYVNKNDDGKVSQNSAIFKRNAKQIQEVLYEQYLKEITDQYTKLLKPLAEKDKILGFIPSNEELKTQNIGAYNIMEEVAKKLGLDSKYIHQNVVKMQANFKSYLTENTEQNLNVYTSALPTNSLESSERLVRQIARANKSFDVFMLSSCIGTGVLHEARWYYDEKQELYVSKPQLIVFVPTYAQVIEPNPLRRTKNLTIAQTHEYKAKLSVVKSPVYINHPELLDEKGKIVDITSPQYIKSLKPVTLDNEQVKYLRSVGKIYDYPWQPTVDLVELGATQSSSKLIRSAHKTNTPKSYETLQEMLHVQRVIDKLPNLVKRYAAENSDKLSKAVKEFDHTNLMEVVNLYRDSNQSEKTYGGK